MSTQSPCELLPGLPNTVGLLCVARVPRIYHATLKAVSKMWKEVVGSKELYDVRKKLGVTDETVFMIKKFEQRPGQLPCLEIDLKTKRSSKALFVNDTVTEEIFNEGYGCASVRHFVLLFGGNAFSEDGAPSGTLHIFDTISRRWSKGANMQCPRGEFGYGVIDDKLYVVGGYAGQGAGLVTDVEIYDAEADAWSCLANMPVAMHIDIFFVWRKQLVVRGLTWPDKRQLVLSYVSAKNEWKEQNWLVNLLSSFKPLVSCASVATTMRDDSIYAGLAEQSYQGRVMEDYVNTVRVKKLDNRTLKWKSVLEYRDEADEESCECGRHHMRLVIFGLQDRVLVLNHLDYDVVGMFKLKNSKEVIKLYVPCPSAWTSSVVNA